VGEDPIDMFSLAPWTDIAVDERTLVTAFDNKILKKWESLDRHLSHTSLD